MILGLYATLGVFLLLPARNPLAHRSLIWFTVWSSIVHGGILAVRSFEHGQMGASLWRRAGVVRRRRRAGIACASWRRAAAVIVTVGIGRPAMRRLRWV